MVNHAQTDAPGAEPFDSERQAQYAAMSEKLALLEMLLSKAPIGLGFVDRDFRRVRVNETLARYNGLTVAEQVGRTVPELVPTLWPQLEPLYRRAIETGEAVLDIEVSGPNEANPKEVRHWRNSYYPVALDGEIVGVGVVAVEDTDLKHAVEARIHAEHDHQRLSNALAESEESFLTVFDIAPIGICLISVNGEHEGEFIRVNDALARLLGHPAEAIKGRRALDFSHPDDRHLVLQPDISQAGSKRIEKRLLHASGRTVWVEINYALVRDHTGAPSYFVVQVEDVETRKESERALLAALEHENNASLNLRKIDSVRTEMVATISHELRTPVTAIGGFLEILADGDLGELNPEQTALVERVGISTRRLKALADDLLALARLDETSSTNDADQAALVEADVLARAAALTLAPILTRRNQTLDTNFSVDDIFVRGDADQLDRALVNILSNASKFSPDGGHLDLNVYAAGGEVHFSVADNGIGIPESEHEKVFERFFRASAADELVIKGTGLGLAIAKSIVDQHGGRIGLESSEGIGSTFTITLPTVAPSRT
jgi:PAS domain S-box-containing protein